MRCDPRIRLNRLMARIGTVPLFVSRAANGLRSGNLPALVAPVYGHATDNHTGHSSLIDREGDGERPIAENVCMAVEGVSSRVMRVPRPSPARVIAPPATSELIPIVVLILGGVLTALSLGSSWVHLAYRMPRMHAVI